MEAMTDGIYRTAPGALFEAARRAPNHVRFIEGGREVTLREVTRRIRGAVARLKEEGVVPGDRVALFAPNSVDWVIAALAVQACGAAFAGIHAGSSAALAEQVVSDSGARLVLASPSELQRAGVEELSAPILLLGEVAEREGGAEETFDESDLDGTACLIYTSGTTGRPKGVVLTHRNLAVNGSDWITVLGECVGEEARDVLWLPFTHIFGWGGACIGTLMGFRSLIAAPSEVAEALVEYRPQVLMTVPVLLERLARTAGDGADLAAVTGGRLRVCLVGGAPFSPRVKQRYRKAGVPVREGYGLTETSPTLTLERADEADPDTVGVPYPSVEVRIDSDGEILARGPSVFGGYHGDPEATREALDDEGWFHTGDLGEFTETGALRITGRKKDLIVLSSGKKVAPAALEAAAAEDGWIERLVVFGNDRPVLVGLVVPDLQAISQDLGRLFTTDQAANDPEVLEGMTRRIEALNRQLSTFERIRSFAIAPRLLTEEAGHLTPSLKVRRHVVWKDFREVLEPLYDRRKRG